MPIEKSLEGLLYTEGKLENVNSSEGPAGLELSSKHPVDSRLPGSVVLSTEQSHLTGESLRPRRGRDFFKAPGQFRRKQNCPSAEELDFSVSLAMKLR